MMSLCDRSPVPDAFTRACSRADMPSPFRADSFITVVPSGSSEVMSIFPASILFTTAMRCCSGDRCDSISAHDFAAFSCPAVASTIHNIIDAFFSLLMVRSMPNASIVSVVERRPAVSIRRNSTPPISIVSSITSRVVPCMSLTIARSSCSNRLSSVDLPTFVAPTIDTGMPSFRAEPVANVAARRVTTRCISSARSSSFRRDANSTSSSEKSSSSSRSEASSSNCSRREFSRPEKSPRICRIATRWAARDDDAMTSATASASARSSRPEANARRVNSPASAMRQPVRTSRFIVSRCIHFEP